MKSGEYIFKTRPAYFFFAFMLAVGAFCLWGSYSFWTLSWESNDGTSPTTILVIRVIFAAFIIFFGLTALWIVITLKVCYLTNTNLIINRPLIFYNQVVPRATILHLKDGKKISISSLNVGHYRELISKLAHRAQ